MSCSKIELPDVGGDEGFSFIWTIQNYSYDFQEIFWAYRSPLFALNEKDLKKWRLIVDQTRFSRKDVIVFALQRFPSDRRVELTLELAIRTDNGIFEKVLDKKVSFDLKSDFQIFGEMEIKREELAAYLNDDSLTMKCRILKFNDVDVTSEHCYAQTTIGVERATYTWNLEGFGEFESEARIRKRLLHLSETSPFTIDFSTAKDEYDNKRIILVEIKQSEPFKKSYSNCKISLVGADGQIAHTVESKCDFYNQSNEHIWKFQFIRVGKILSNKKLYLPNGILCLKCEVAVSTVLNNRIEYGITNNQLLQCCNLRTESNLSGCLKENLKRFYAEGKFSDLTIRTPNRDFPAHKTILCARSEVFSAMLERDMKEAQTGVVEIDDVDDDTVSKMLLFMYTDTVGEGLEFGSASSLYFAADKYEIVALKRKCSDFLKGNFTVSNVCDVLVLADMHQDQKLKSAAQKFIFDYSGEIMKSEEWKKLMKNQLQLASETMHLYIQNLKV